MSTYTKWFWNPCLSQRSWTTDCSEVDMERLAWMGQHGWVGVDGSVHWVDGTKLVWNKPARPTGCGDNSMPYQILTSWTASKQLGTVSSHPSAATSKGEKSGKILSAHIGAQQGSIHLFQEQFPCHSLPPPAGLEAMKIWMERNCLHLNPNKREVSAHLLSCLISLKELSCFISLKH